MANVNRFEIGGIFYDCEDSDARNEIEALQQKQRPLYTQREVVPDTVITSVQPTTLYTATKKCVVHLGAFPADHVDETISRGIELIVNQRPVMSCGTDSPNPGGWFLGSYELYPGDVLTVRKLSDQGNGVTVMGSAVPYGPAT